MLSHQGPHLVQSWCICIAHSQSRGEVRRLTHLQGFDSGDGAGVSPQHEGVQQLGIHVAQGSMHDSPAGRRRCAFAPQRFQHIAQTTQQALRRADSVPKHPE